MTSIITFTPLYGVSENQPLCYLLKIDDFNMLLDCGWDENFDEALLQPLKQVIMDIDAVLISHPDVAHLGALPYAVGKLGLSCPIYCTLPVWKMGQMFMYDIYQHLSQYKFDKFDLDDVDKAFDQLTHLKYSQETALEGKGEGIVCTPFAAGHMLGGTIWMIQKETEQVIYAVDCNHARDRHLEAGVLGTFTQPTVLITDAQNALVQRPKRKLRDMQLMSTVMETLQRQGNVLLPVDTAGRVLELLVMLHRQWTLALKQQQQGKTSFPYQLVLLSNVGDHTIDFARGQIEWMSASIQKEFDTQRDNPFSFPELRICHSLDQVRTLAATAPLCVLATSETLDHGFAQDLFIEWSSDKRNMIVFTSRTPDTTLASRVLAMVRRRDESGATAKGEDDRKKRNKDEKTKTSTSTSAMEVDDGDGGDGVKKEETADDDDASSMRITFQRCKNEELEGEALQHYLDQQKMEEERRGLERSSNVLEEDSDSGDDDDDMDMLQIGFKRMKPIRVQKLTAAFAMFPCVEEKSSWDQFGQSLKMEDYNMISRSIALSGGAAGTVGSTAAVGPDGFAHSMDVDGDALLAEQQRAREQEELAAAAAAAAVPEPEKPFRTITIDVTVTIQCRILYIDFEGRSDGSSIQNILSNIQPRKLILVRGSDAAKQHLLEHCQRPATQKSKKAICEHVAMPKTNQSIDITSDTNIYVVNLHSSLTQTLRFSQIDDYEVAWADGEVRMDDDGGGDAAAAASTPMMPVLKAAPTHRVQGHPAVFLGNVKFSSLKATLNQAGIQADFYGGILVCMGGLVNVRKLSPTQLSIQGCLCDEYYKIRSLLYGKYQIL